MSFKTDDTCSVRNRSEGCYSTIFGLSDLVFDSIVVETKVGNLESLKSLGRCTARETKLFSVAGSMR